MLKKGFTLIEILIVLSLISILTVAVLATIHPKEQKLKAIDTNTLKLATEIFLAVDRYDSNQESPPFDESLTNITFQSSEGQAILDKLIDSKELKTSVKNSLYLTYLDFSGQDFPLLYSICFQPQSASYQKNSDQYKFYKPDNDNCFICVTNNESGLNLPTPTNQPVPTNPIFTPIPPTNTPDMSDPCSGDPEYPVYPSTSFFLSSKFSQYGCDRFQATDRSCQPQIWTTWNTPCLQICQAGQRCLVKHYTNPNTSSIDGANCLAHSSQAVEYYCVDDPYANCTKFPGISSDYNFDFGCSNPRRPINWKPEYL